MMADDFAEIILALRRCGCTCGTCAYRVEDGDVDRCRFHEFAIDDVARMVCAEWWERADWQE